MNRVTQYANDVLNGKIVTGWLVRLACERHLQDLGMQGTPNFPYVFDETKANRILNFAEKLKFAEGEQKNTGKRVKLLLFQCFILGSLFGWVHKDTGYRRYRTSYVQLGRQNSKSFLNGILGIYCSNFDGYQYGQIYTTATKQDQAKIVLNEMIKMIRADSELEDLFKIKEYESTVEAKLTKSVVKALGRDTKSIDGFRPYLGIVDEYHAHKDNQMYKLLEDGTVMLDQSLISVITTAGFDMNAPCKELYDYCSNLLQGVFTNHTQFVYIAQMDAEDDIWNPDNWIKANPLVASTAKGIENIKNKATTAQQMGGNELKNLMTKTFNVWVQMGDDDYINIDKWKACASDLTLEDMSGKECYVGLDLSSGGDLTSLAFEFRMPDNKYFIHSHSFMPKERLQEHINTDLVPYDIWLQKGLLTLTEGFKTDYKQIIKYLSEVQERYNIQFKMICYDPYNSATFLQDLDVFGCDLVEIRQSAKNLSDATEDFKLEVDAGGILYNRENELLTWSIVNAKLTYNSFQECKIEKNSRVKRIDPVDAVIDAHKMAFTQKEEVDLNQFITDDYLSALGW